MVNKNVEYSSNSDSLTSMNNSNVMKWVPQDVKDWLAQIGRNRQWLADLLTTTKGNVDQYFSKGFPDWALKIIKLHIENQSKETELQFSTSEWKTIQQAMATAGYSDEFAFFHDAIAAYAEQVSTDEKSLADKSKILPIAGLTDDPVEYGKAQKGKV